MLYILTKVLIFSILIFGFINLCMGFHQDSYHIIHDKVIIEVYNHSAMQDPFIAIEAYNSTFSNTTIRASAYFLTPCKRKSLITASPYKLVRNVYRSFPLNVTIDLCDELLHNKLGTRFVVQHSNVGTCPLAAGYYYLKDYVLEEDKFPPRLPFGKYKLHLEIYVDDTIFLLNATWEGQIVKKNKS